MTDGVGRQERGGLTRIIELPLRNEVGLSWTKADRLEVEWGHCGERTVGPQCEPRFWSQIVKIYLSERSRFLRKVAAELR